MNTKYRLATSKISKEIKGDFYFTNHYKNSITSKVLISKENFNPSLIEKVCKESRATKFRIVSGNNDFLGVIFYFNKNQVIKRK